MEEMQTSIRVEGFEDPLVGFVGFEDPLLGRELWGRTVEVQVPGLEGLDLLRFTIRRAERPIEGQIRFEKDARDVMAWLERRGAATFRFSETGRELAIF